MVTILIQLMHLSSKGFDISLQYGGPIAAFSIGYFSLDRNLSCIMFFSLSALALLV